MYGVLRLRKALRYYGHPTPVKYFMNKTEVLRRLRAAKRAHLTWVSHITALFEGLEVKNKDVPLGPKKSQFGQWYYGEGQNLSEFESFSRIHNPHKKMHKALKELRDLLEGRDITQQNSLWKRLTKKKDDSLEKSTLSDLYMKLKTNADDVTRQLDNLEKEINSKL